MFALVSKDVEVGSIIARDVRCRQMSRVKCALNRIYYPDGKSPIIVNLCALHLNEGGLA